MKRVTKVKRKGALCPIGVSNQGKVADGRRWVFLFAVVAMASLIVYLNSVTNQFVFDDLHLITENPAIRGLKNFLQFTGIVSGVSYRPVRTLSYVLDYTLNQILWRFWGSYRGSDPGLNPVGYHISNYAYHLITALLVFLVSFKLVADYRVAFLTASLFALHPVHTDSVTYLSGRRDILCALFYLAGFYYFLRFREVRSGKFLAWACIFYCLGLGSKEMAVTLPAIILCYDIVNGFPAGTAKIGFAWLRQASSTVKRVLVQHRFFYALFFLGALSFSYYKVFIQSPSHQEEYYGGSMVVTFCTMLKILMRYIKLMIFPVVLNADYSYNAFPLSTSLFELATFMSFILLVVLGYLVIRLIGNYKVVSFGLLWFFVTLLPVSQLFPHHELMAEHYLYLPSFGYCLAMAFLVNEIIVKERYLKLMFTLLLGVVFLFCVRIIDRNRDWRNGFTLWKKTVETVPQCARARNNLGSEYDARGWFNEASYEYERALAIKPDYAEPYNNLGRLAYTKGRIEEAEALYRKALELDPQHFAAYVNLGGAYLARGRIEEAFGAFLKANRIRPHRAEVYVGFGVCVAKRVKSEEDLDVAIHTFKKALELKPNTPEAHNNLASTYYLKGDYRSARYHANKVRELGYEVSPQLAEALALHR